MKRKGQSSEKRKETLEANQSLGSAPRPPLTPRPLCGPAGPSCGTGALSGWAALNDAGARRLPGGTGGDNTSGVIASYRFMNFLPLQSQTSDVYFIKRAFRSLPQFP